MDPHTHKLLDVVEHITPLVTGFFITLVAAVRLWWTSKKALHERISNVERIAEHAVTYVKLKECKDEVQEIDHVLLEEIKSIRQDMRRDFADNAHAHTDIMNTMISLHAEKHAEKHSEK